MFESNKPEMVSDEVNYLGRIDREIEIYNNFYSPYLHCYYTI